LYGSFRRSLEKIKAMSKSPGMPSNEINLSIALILILMGTTKGTKTTKGNNREKNFNLYLCVLRVLCG
jgi:hypothetical protein